MRPLALLGRTIRSERKKQGLSQEELALRAHLNRTYLSHVERGTAKVGLLAVLRIARALDIPITTLLSEFTPSRLKRMRLE
jgi:transcriptional regulator with XRE-family HTH domain